MLITKNSWTYFWCLYRAKYIRINKNKHIYEDEIVIYNTKAESLAQYYQRISRYTKIKNIHTNIFFINIL